MNQNVEIKSFNLRYESNRMKHKVAEDALLCSILENDIFDPLEGIDINKEQIVLKMNFIGMVKGFGFVKTVKYLKTFLPNTSDSYMEKRQELLIVKGKSIGMGINR